MSTPPSSPVLVSPSNFRLPGGTPREVLAALSPQTMNAYEDNLKIEEIPDFCGIPVSAELRRRKNSTNNRNNINNSSINTKVKETVHHYVECCRLVVAMVGLPARGKSYTANKIQSYFKWLGMKVKIFNVGAYRRLLLKSTVEDQSAKFFDSNNEPARRIREMLALEVLDLVLQWLDEGGEIAIFDATNTTNERRNNILEKARNHHNPIEVVFVENVCDDPYILAQNFKQKILLSPDYESLSVEGASQDLTRRILNYEKVYETITDDNCSYIKIMNLKSKVICNKINGTVPRMLIDYILKLHIQSRQIFYAQLPPKSDDEFSDKFAQKLSESIQKQIPQNMSQLIVFTETSSRAQRIAKCIPGGATVIPTTTVNNLDFGLCHDMTEKQIAETMPEVWSALQNDRFNFRLPGGESFADLIQRLRPFVLELELLNVPVLILAQATPFQGLYTYFKNMDVEISPYYQVPHNTLIELFATRFGWKEKHYSIM